ncbi:MULTISPECIES: glycosyltransferase [unclassified Sphingomonas]|uniref:glycosyltransferase n=1 Tax=unclassified Sphingomonas TaxID=196159 RepID=UPI000AE696F6|nr:MULTISPECIES: glycosyltransferase [unclassified Sphingomonas]
MGKLLSINSYHYRRGGSDAVYLDHARLFTGNGWENRFFSMKHPRNLPTEDDRHFIELVDSEYASGAAAKLNVALRTIYNPDSVTKVRRILGEYRPDVAHIHCAYHHITPSILPVLTDHGVPIVITAHDLKILCPAYKMMNAGGICERCKTGSVWNVASHRCVKDSLGASLIVGAEAALYRRMDSYRKHVALVVSPSKFYRDKFLEWGWPEDRIAHVPNFSAPVDARFIQDYSAPITYFGRLAPEKGLSTLVRAAAAASVPVEIIGSGPSLPEISALIASLNAPVVLRGRLDGDALWDAVGRARAIVLPSEWYENGPMSVLEAFYLERPVLGADIGGIPEMIADADGGWLFESGNVTALAQALRTVDDTGTAQLAERGRSGSAYARVVHSSERYFDSVARLYAGLKPA